MCEVIAGCVLSHQCWGWACLFFWVICGPEFYIQPSNVGRVTVLLELYASWEFCLFIVFKSVEIKFCKVVSSALFIYVVIQKLIHYLNLLCVIPLLPINAVSVNLCKLFESFKFVHYPWHYGVEYCLHSSYMSLEGFVCNWELLLWAVRSLTIWCYLLKPCGNVFNQITSLYFLKKENSFWNGKNLKPHYIWFMTKG